MKKISALIFWLSSLSVLFAQGPSDSWTRSYGGSNSDQGNSVISTNDGGSIFIGSTRSPNGDVVGLHSPFGWNYSDFWVVKLNSNGTIQWQKCFGGSKNEVGFEIIQLSDGGYVIVGSCISNDGDVTLHYGSDSFTDAWIIKLDNSGNLLWQKTYGGYSDEYARSVTETADGGLLVAAILNIDYNGTVPITYNQSMDYWVLKLNSSGELQWNNHYGGENSDLVSSIKATPDGGCIVAGQSGSHYFDVVNSINPISGDIPDYWIVKLSPTGTIQWQKSYGGLQSDWATSICITNDGGYIIAGNTNSNNTGTVTNFHGGVDGYVIKLNPVGDLEWQKCIGGTSNDLFNSIIQTIDGGYIACGIADSSDGDLNGVIPGGKAWIVKLTSSGNISWQRHYMEVSGNTFNDISQNTDGTYIAVGYRNYFQNYDNYDVFAVKLNAESLSNLEFDKFHVTLYPNAVDEILYIQSNGEIDKEITIYDVQGKKVNSFFVENNSVDLRSLQKGFYFIEIKNELNQSIKKKILKN